MLVLERDDELEAACAALAAARAGRGSVVWIDGPAGVGKSTLLRAVGRPAAELGLSVLRAAGSELTREVPFGVAVELFEPALRAAGADRRQLLIGAARPAWALFGGGGDRPPEEGALVHALHWLAVGLAERRPLLLAVDDLQWADLPSLRFLAFLAQRVGDLPVVVAGAWRTGEPSAGRDLAVGLTGAPAVVRLPLSGLAPDSVAELVRRRLPDASDAFCASCATLSAGNPLLVTELLRAGAGRSDGPLDAEELGRIAAGNLADAVGIRLERLPAPTTALARAVAVLSHDARLRRAARLAGIDLEAAATAADTLMDAELLASSDPPRFVHPLVEEAVRRGIGEADLAVARLRAARLLADEAGEELAVAAQLQHAARTGDAWVVEQLRAAAAASRGRGAPAAAAGQLRRALEEPPPAAQRVGLLVELAEAEAEAGLPEAPGRLEDALALIDDRGERARLLSRLGWMLHKGGRLEEAAAAFQRGLAELDGTDAELTHELRLGFIGAGWQVEAYTEAARREWLALLERGEAPRAGDRALAAHLATLQLMRGASVAEVLDHVERASADGRLVAEEGSDSLTLWSVVGCLSWADELDRAEALIELALADARERGLALAQAQCLYARSWPRLWRGDVDGTVADAQFAVRVWEGGWGYYLPAAIHWLVRGEIERDDLDAAERSLTLEGGEERWGATTMYVLWRHARASVLAARGRHDAALAEFLECGRSVTEEFGLPNPAILAWRSSAALSAVALGRDDEARALAREELELARAFGAARPIGIALRALGLVERGTAGVAHLREAVAVLEPSAARLELARALVDLGMLLRIGGSPRAAREPLRRALDELSRMSGAHALRRRAEAELATAGGRPRRPALTGADALTPAERRVAELAAAGLSNPEIAQELFVARKTVEWHLGNVYAKLEVSSRDEIAAAIGGAPSGQSVSPTV